MPVIICNIFPNTERTVIRKYLRFKYMTFYIFTFI